MSETKFFHVTSAGNLVALPTVAKAIAAAKKDGYIWLDYCEPSRKEIEALMRPLGLHPLAVEDCTDATHQLPKVDEYPKHTFMVLNAFNYAGHALAIYEVDVFIGANFVVTVHERDEN